MLRASRLMVRRLEMPSVQVSSKAVVSDSPWWIKDYAEAKSFVTLTDEKGQHLIFHGDCGGRPVFLSDGRVLTSVCNIARILDTPGNILKEITLHDPVSFAGVSQNGERFALQVVNYPSDHSIRRERFVSILSTQWRASQKRLLPNSPRRSHGQRSLLMAHCLSSVLR